MSFEKIGLGKFLILITVSQRKLTAETRKSIREDIKKKKMQDLGENLDNARNFYTPFWSDAKAHLSGEIDLHIATAPLRDVARWFFSLVE